MILQSLNRFYRILRDDPQTDIPRFGYSTIGVRFALNLSAKGELLDVLPQFTTAQRGRKMIEVPRSMFLPQRVERSGNKIAPNFLWDNSAYVLGLSDRDDEKPEYSRERFEAFRHLHKDLLNEIDNAAARAVVSFLDIYDPSSGREHPAIARHLETLLQGGNLVFMVEGAFVHEEPALREIWESHHAGKEAERMQCLVTGEFAPISRLHPSIERVRGTNPRGAKLVSFDDPAFESYNRTKRTKGQGLNSPVSERATFAYTTALNYLLSDANPNKKFYLGDTTVVYWAESENRAYEAGFACILDPDYVPSDDEARLAGRNLAEAALDAAASKVRQAQMIDLDALLADLGEENPRFYVLGLAPNAARVSVRFFITDPFKKIFENIMAHYRDLSIVKEFDDQPDYLTVGRILSETVSKKSRDRDAAPLLAGAVFRAILTNAPYPAALYNAILIRIRADMDDPQRRVRKINYVRAAVIKAFLKRKYRHNPQKPFEEVLTMALNEQSTIPAYLLGRLFAVLEKVQADAIGEMNATIKDRYFTSACASPASVFPILLRLSQHHIAKAEYGRYWDGKIEEILNLLDLEQNPIPARLTLDDQGVFVLGYYHQRAAIFKPKEEQIAAESA